MARVRARARNRWTKLGWEPGLGIGGMARVGARSRLAWLEPV